MDTTDDCGFGGVAGKNVPLPWRDQEKIPWNQKKFFPIRVTLVARLTTDIIDEFVIGDDTGSPHAVPWRRLEIIGDPDAPDVFYEFFSQSWAEMPVFFHD